jgi:cellulose biosynthesis protein BcsQ
MAVSATLADLRRKDVDVQISAVLLNSVDPHRTTYQLLREALLGAQLPLMAAEIPMRADFQNAVTAGIPLVYYAPSHPGSEAIRVAARELMGIRAPLARAA